MHKDLIVKTRSLGGSSDLTLLAPIKAGLVPSLESVTYKTRIRRVLQTLNAGRSNAHEAALLRPFADAVERVGRIHAVRVAIVEPDQVLLSVSFDGGRESYLRVLWQKVGALLDLIFCSTKGYVLSTGRFEDWAAWVCRVQIETDFYYGMPGHTVDDVQYLRNSEALRSAPKSAGAESRHAIQARNTSAERQAWDLQMRKDPRILVETGRQGVRALVALHRLTALFLPGTADGNVLLRGARDLLAELVMLAEQNRLDAFLQGARVRFDEQISWLLKPQSPREVPPAARGTSSQELGDVQAGIVRPYPDDITHGCLLLVAVHDRSAAALLIGALLDRMQFDGAQPQAGQPFVGMAFTFEGLRAVGVSEPDLELFPFEFQQGMAARASLLGDVRTNHPQRWRLPMRNWPGPSADPRAVELSAVHLVVQLRIAADSGLADIWDIHDARHPLRATVQALFDNREGVELLAVEPLVRLRTPEGKVREHFGYVDGSAQPVLEPAANGQVYDRNLIHLGELLHGHTNQAEQPGVPVSALTPDQYARRERWMYNGCFLAVRKLRQDVPAFEAAVAMAAAESKLNPDLIKAKLMGRHPDGTALTAAAPRDANDFDFERDPKGVHCPIHAHIRRANPRTPTPEWPDAAAGQRTPRILRRGMSFGPIYSETAKDQPRGLMFMALNQSLAEQFEVVQRWMSGGNSSGGYSGQSDSLLGVPHNGQERHYRFQEGRRVHRMRLDGSSAPLGDPKPLVRLDWGIYLFVPARPALEALRVRAASRAGRTDLPWSVARGADLIEGLRKIRGKSRQTKAWKALLEDPRAREHYDSASVWAAIRTLHGGVLRTPYGVVVADRDKVMQVLANAQGCFSVRGYRERMLGSVGDIYLGLDDQGKGCPYRKDSFAANRAIRDITRAQAYALAHRAATDLVRERIEAERTVAVRLGEPRWELSLTAREVFDRVLETLCQHWFGLPNPAAELQPGGARWDWPVRPGDPPRYPGHFTAPSRYFFQPRPGKEVRNYGTRYGRALRDAMLGLVQRLRRTGQPPQAPGGADAPVARAIFDAFPEDDTKVAETMVGAIMGFVPTLDGNFQLTLDEWLRSGSFWSMRARWAAGISQGDAEFERTVIETMMLRPSPELIWRTVAADSPPRLGEVQLQTGDTVVLALVSATQQCLEEGRDDVWPIFGGDRRAGAAAPTHACPGYEAAMGALLGLFAALIEHPASMRPSPVPLAFLLEGDIP